MYMYMYIICIYYIHFVMKYDPGFCSQDSPAGGTSDEHLKPD